MELTIEQLNTAIDQAVRRAVPPAPAETPVNDTLRQQLEAIVANDEGRNWFTGLMGHRGPDPENPETESEAADLGARMNPVADALRSVDNVGGLNIPVGSALAGLGLALVASEVIDGFQAPTTTDATTGDTKTNFINVGLKLGAAVGVIEYGDKLIGQRAAQFTAGFLVFQAVRQVTPLDTWVARFVAWIKQTFTAGNRFGARQYQYSPQITSQLAQRNRMLQSGQPSYQGNQVVIGAGAPGRDDLGYVFK